MKKFLIIGGFVSLVVAVTSCSDIKRNPGRVYMPDMAYSRAYETYASTEALTKEGVNYTSLPVPGTIARGDMNPYTLKNDSVGYAQSAFVKSQLDSSTYDKVEAERLFLVNCAICHGPKLDGNGPLYKGGEGPYPAKPAVLVGDPKLEAMPEGTMFHSVTYGKNAMGSYASQLSTKQRWMVIAYIKSQQAKAKAGTTTAAPAADSTGTKVKAK
jgi:mono/diheme cytochrome c family protein